MQAKSGKFLHISKKKCTFAHKLNSTMNTFGTNWTFTSFGESHGAAIGGVLDGVPAGLKIDMNLIREELERRSKGVKELRSEGVSGRALREPDEVEWLSGVIKDDAFKDSKFKDSKFKDSKIEESKGDGRLITLGTPIAFLIRNKDARPEDYEWLKHNYRVGHADKVYEQKYGLRDWRGGGRASARETASRVVAGSIAKQELAQKGVSIHAELVQVGEETNPKHFEDTISSYRREGDSIGGIVECRISGLPVGIGEPIFNKLQAELAFAVMSINACKGFEYGTGFEGVSQPGSAINAISGGISGGISDGSDIVFRCVFKPTPTTPKALEQFTIHNSQCTIHKGRHDACVAVRAVPVVEAMTALVLVDLLS